VSGFWLLAACFWHLATGMDGVDAKPLNLGIQLQTAP